jgi:membrane-associated protease RseP (regulator of RpoE activity)
MSLPPPPVPPPGPDPSAAVRPVPYRPGPWAPISLGLGFVALCVLEPWWAVAIGAIILVITLHELGHYLTAKWSGMKVTEFFLGFGPRIWSTHRGETEYGVKAIPLGAYVKVIGMNNLDPGVEPAEENRTFRQATYPRRVLMASAGSLMHFLIAFVCGIWLLAGYGQVTNSSWRIADIAVGSPAERAGLQVGDKIVSLNGRPLTDYAKLRSTLRAAPGQSFVLGVQRDGSTFTRSITTDSTCGGTVGRIGIGSEAVPIDQNIGQAIGGSASLLARGIGTTAAGIGRIFSPTGVRNIVDDIKAKPATTTVFCAGGEGERPSSIIGITNFVGKAAQEGLRAFLEAMVGFNIGIGVLNLIPMLPLDGGHILIATYERIREIGSPKRYHADVAKLLPVVYGFLAVLLLLFLSAGYLDIVHPVGG